MVLLRINSVRKLVTLFHGKNAATYWRNIMEALLISIASFATPVALSIASIGAAAIAEKVTAKDEE